MKSYVLSIFSAVLFVVGVSAQITLNTPATVIECSPVQLSWTGGATPVTISSHNGAAPYGAPIDTYTNVTTNPFQTPNAITLPGVGQSIGWTITDKNGLQSITAPVTIQPGGTCASGSSASGASTPVAPSGSSSSTSTLVVTTSGSTPAASSSKPTSSAPASTVSASKAPATASSSSSASTSRANAAMATGVPYGAAGLLGAVIAAVFA